jgi:hypothetical protein
LGVVHETWQRPYYRDTPYHRGIHSIEGSFFTLRMLESRLLFERCQYLPALVGRVPANRKLFFLIEANQIGKVDSIELDGFFTLLRRKTLNLFPT